MKHARLYQHADVLAVADGAEAAPAGGMPGEVQRRRVSVQ